MAGQREWVAELLAGLLRSRIVFGSCPVVHLQTDDENTYYGGLTDDGERLLQLYASNPEAAIDQFCQDLKQEE